MSQLLIVPARCSLHGVYRQVGFRVACLRDVTASQSLVFLHLCPFPSWDLSHPGDPRMLSEIMFVACCCLHVLEECFG